MSSNLTNISASIKARLQNIARKTGRPFNELLRLYGIERFLYRLSISPYNHSFVLKGGLIFLTLDLPFRRPTRDIDLRGFTQNSVENIISIIINICQQSVDDDGLIFRSETVIVEMRLLDADYQGIRATFMGMLGKAEIPMQVDIGFSDEITPSPVSISYPSLLAMPFPQLYGYPLVSVISEKFHAIVQLGEINSRMKDYYDIWLLSDYFDFDGHLLQSAITHTFNRRGTIVPDELPFGLSSAFAASHDKAWKVLMKHIGYDNKNLDDFEYVLQRLRMFLLPPMVAIAHGMDFNHYWRARNSWE
jgi:predicted nucleotidyltransferase component of viral defense system